MSTRSPPNIRSTQTKVTQWRRQLIDQAAEVFSKPAGKAPADDREALLAKIGELTVQNDFFARVLGK